MVHLNVSHAAPQAEVSNAPCQHAFALMGEETIFGVHMTQYHCDKHRYQVVLRLELPEKARAYLARIEELAGVPVDIISTGPDREQTIIKTHPFE